MPAAPDFSAIDRHQGCVAFGFSGGKDSTTVLHMLREAGRLADVTVYHVDTGDLLPEMVEHVAREAVDIPQFIRIETGVLAWQAENGLPSDLVPHTQHPVAQGMGEGRGARVVGRYDCCWANLMWPFYRRAIVEDGNTLLIRGTKSADMARLPMRGGDALGSVELCLPLQDWSHAEVRAYLDKRGVKLPPLYGCMTNAPECARCTAWWAEGRGAYLRDAYPALHRDYAARLAVVLNEIGAASAPLRGEAEACGLV